MRTSAALTSHDIHENPTRDYVVLQSDSDSFYRQCICVDPSQEQAQVLKLRGQVKISFKSMVKINIIMPIRKKIMCSKQVFNST